MKIGLFGGAFNPVHNGHINLAKSYIDNLKLDKFIFIPTANPPHKSSSGLAKDKDRINMLNLAISSIDNAIVSNIEFKLDGKSYTYNTVCELKKIYPDDDFYLIVGADQFLNFKNWYKYKELLNMVTLCTAAREKSQYDELKRFYENDDIMSKYDCVVANIPVYVVSSSQIRDLIKNNNSVNNYLPSDVSKYIKDNNLYV